VASYEAVDRLQWTEGARALAGIFWPGALTLVLEDPERIFPSGVRHDGDGTVAVRVSPHPIVARLIETLGGPITSTSLNVAGQSPASSGHAAADVVRRLGTSEVLVLDAGTLPPSGPSTVVDCTGERPIVIREGTVPIGRLRCAIREIDAKPRR
jgi:tRNA threonylcarbamoyl adenosine modification protein (Sua5/YciO/YrdC/YwlC family)